MRYNDKLHLLYTDTDSLVLFVETDDLYADMKQDLVIYKTSNYPEDHPLYTTANKKVVRQFKDELCGEPICEFVALRSKMYACECAGGSSGKQAKGVQRDVVKTIIMIADHRSCLTEETQVMRIM